jgi:hypothetical protein
VVDSHFQLPWTDAFRRILMDEGFAGLYQGLPPALMLVSHGMIQVLTNTPAYPLHPSDRARVFDIRIFYTPPLPTIPPVLLVCSLRYTRN